MSDVNLYIVGEVIRASVTLRSVVGNTLVDPSTLVVYVLHPDKETTDTYVYGTDTVLIRDSAGLYHVDFEATEAGEWIYRYVSTGNGAGAGQKKLNVNSSLIPAT